LVIFDEVEAGSIWGFSLNQIGIDVVTAHTRQDAVEVMTTQDGSSLVAFFRLK